MFGPDWEAAQATIVARKVGRGLFGSKDKGGDHGGTAYDYVVDVQPTDGTPLFRATFEGPWDDHTKGGFLAPDVGQVVGVRFNPKTREVKFDSADKTVYRDGRNWGKSEADAFEAVADMPAGSAPPSSTGEVGGQGAAFAEEAAAFNEQATEFRQESDKFAEWAASFHDQAAAIARAKASGNRAEVERLKAEFKRREDENP